MKIDLKNDLEQLFSDFKWKIKGMIDEDGNIYPIPPIPQVITGIFQEITKHKVKNLMKEKYKCEIVQGGPSSIKGLDKSSPYNIWVFHLSPSVSLLR
jgi:hypothetical protein